MDKLQELKEYIQKEIPEIMELKFGCEVFLHGCLPDCVIADSGWHKYIKKDTFVRMSDDNDSNPQGKIIDDRRGSEVRIYGKNLGRPITLEDVLKMLNDDNLNIGIANTGGFYSFNEDKVLHTFGKFFRDKSGETIYWYFNKPLDQQSEETISFLHELLIKNK